MEIKLRLVDVAEFVGITEMFNSDINIRSVHNGIMVDAKSIMSVLGLDLGSKLHIEINSSDESELENFKRKMRKYEVINGN